MRPRRSYKVDPSTILEMVGRYTHREIAALLGITTKTVQRAVAAAALTPAKKRALVEMVRRAGPVSDWQSESFRGCRFVAKTGFL